MKYVKQRPSPPPALQLLVTADDDADGTEFVLQAAREWARGSLVLVINATGKDLSGYATRHDFAVLCDDAGRPTRSLSEIAETFETMDPAEVGAVVLLDANRLYRATRCSVRHLEDLKRLSPGHWDDTNEALGRACELLIRKGVPSIFAAPPTDVYGTDEDGEPVAVGHKPQAWKDLVRQAHATLRVTRSGRRTDVEVTGDDFRRLGQPGTVLEGVSGATIGARFADLARGGGGAGGTTLAEATAAELAARARLAERGRARSEELRDRFVGLAQLRAYQGPEAWAQHVQELASARGELLPDDLDKVDRTMAKVYETMASTIEWMRQAEVTVEHSPYSLRESLGGKLAGPDPKRCPVELPAERVRAKVEQLLEAREPILATCEPEELPGWVSSLARYAGVWDETSFAAVCNLVLQRPVREVQVDPRYQGPEWSAYTERQLRQLALALVTLAHARREYDHVDGPQESRVEPALETVEDESEDLDEIHESLTQDAMEVMRELQAERDREDPLEEAASEPDGSEQTSWPDPAAFAAWTEQRQRDSIGYFMHEVRAFDRWEEVRAEDPETIGASKSPRRWNADERVAVYRVLYRWRHADMERAA